MRVLASLLLLPLAACPSQPDPWLCGPDPIWSVAPPGGGVIEAFAAMPDGDAVLAGRDYLATLDRGGAVTANVAAPDLDGFTVSRIDVGGDGLVVSGTVGDQLRVVAYDRSLAARWSVAYDHLHPWAYRIDVGLAGEVAIWRDDTDETTRRSTLHLLEADGTERWNVQIDAPVVATMRVATDGDVLAGWHRLAAADGAVGDLGGNGVHRGRDGSIVGWNTISQVSSHAVTGVLRWRTQLDVEPWDLWVVDDEVVLVLAEDYDIYTEESIWYAVDLDAATGAERGRHEVCSGQDLLVPALDGYLARSRLGVALYPHPR